MTRYGFVCLLLGALAWGQATTPAPTPANQNPASPASSTAAPQAPAANPGESQESDTSKVAPDAPIITIPGLCEQADKASPDCKTVITREEFEKVVDAVAPKMPPRARRQFASRYINALAMSMKAHEMGLDQGPKFEERMKLMRIQVLSQAVGQAIQEKASQVSDKDIEDYYNAHIADFEEVDLHRIYIPRTQEMPTPKTKLTAAEKKERTKQAETTMKQEADKLHARAVAGEDFSKLQPEAYTVASNKSKPPAASMGKVRRNTLPPSQVSVMDLKPGTVSAVFSDQTGYFIYKVGQKETPPVDKVRDQITVPLRSQRMQQEMQAVQKSTTPILDDNYFGPEMPAGGPMMPGPGGGAPVKPQSTQPK